MHHHTWLHLYHFKPLFVVICYSNNRKLIQMGKILIGQCHVKDIQVEGTVPQVTCELSQGISALYASDFLSIK
jgi:hypothetical protein